MVQLMGVAGKLCVRSKLEDSKMRWVHALKLLCCGSNSEIMSPFQFRFFIMMPTLCKRSLLWTFCGVLCYGVILRVFYVVVCVL